MSDTQTSPAGARRAAGRAPTRPTGWVGWIVFAGVTMILLGAFQIIEGLVAVFERGFYLVTSSHLLVNASYAAWGWLHIGLGVVLLLTGFGVMAGMLWARIVGIAFAVISAIINLAFIAAYPVWGFIIIVMNVLVIYALAVHGREMQYG